MTMTLYYRDNTAALAPRVVLEELGESYELVETTRDDSGPGGPPEFFAISPHGTVPAFRDGDVGMSETIAVLMYLADTHPESPLGSALGSAERGEWYRWLCYLANTVMTPFYGFFYPERWGGDAGAEYATTRLNELYDWLDAELADREYLVGGRYTMCDTLLGMLTLWGDELKTALTTGRPNITAHSDRFRARPATQKVFAAEGVK